MSLAIASRTKGAVQQYGTAGTIGPFDSGSIIGTVPPGQTGIKQIDGTIQNATDLTVGGVTSTNESLNFLPSSAGVGLVPTVNSAQIESNGLSMSPQTE